MGLNPQCLIRLCTALQAAIQRCSQLRHLELLTHNSWKVDKPCPLRALETIIDHLFEQLPNLKVSNIITCFLMPLLYAAAQSQGEHHCVPMPGSRCSVAR